MQFKNIQLQHLNEVEKLTENGFEIYENETGAIFINHNEEYDLSDFIGAYLDYHDYNVLKSWDIYGRTTDDYEIIQVIF